MKHYLDVSQLEPPEPMERILGEVKTLHVGHFLHIFHWREPFPLYSLLESMNLCWLTDADDQGMYHIVIWQNDDSMARKAAKSELSRHCKI